MHDEGFGSKRVNVTKHKHGMGFCHWSVQCLGGEALSQWWGKCGEIGKLSLMCGIGKLLTLMHGEALPFGMWKMENFATVM